MLIIWKSTFPQKVTEINIKFPSLKKPACAPKQAGLVFATFTVTCSLMQPKLKHNLPILDPKMNSFILPHEMLVILTAVSPQKRG
jgi:hypothetical protein